jgi:DNA-binding NarL/FixJ family response regulator
MSGPAHVRVLTADDHAAFRSTARELVAATPGFVALAEAASGEQAVDLAAGLEPDLVLMDVHMDGIGGIEAARRILAMRPVTVLALVSVYAAADLPECAWTCGADAILRKDVLRPRVLKALWELGHERRPARPLTSVG